MIVDISDKFTGQFLMSRFASKFFLEENKIHPLGNILAFRAGVTFRIDSTHYVSDDAINFCIELPGRDRFTTAAIHKIFNSNVGSILGSQKYLNASIEIDSNKIIVNKEHKNSGVIMPQGKVSFSANSFVNGAGMIYTGINIMAGKEAPAIAFSTEFNDKQCIEFMNDVNNMFYGMVNEVFVESSK